MNSKQLPQIFVINLDRSTDRLQFVQGQFEKIGLSFERIIAVGGAKLDSAYLKECTKDSSRTFTHFTTLSSGEIGCAMSQRNGWKLAAVSDTRATVILEDDIEIYENILNYIENREHISKYIEIY